MVRSKKKDNKSVDGEPCTTPATPSTPMTPMEHDPPPTPADGSEDNSRSLALASVAVLARLSESQEPEAEDDIPSKPETVHASANPKSDEPSEQRRLSVTDSTSANPDKTTVDVQVDSHETVPSDTLETLKTVIPSDNSEIANAPKLLPSPTETELSNVSLAPQLSEEVSQVNTPTENSDGKGSSESMNDFEMVDKDAVKNVQSLPEQNVEDYIKTTAEVSSSPIPSAEKVEPIANPSPTVTDDIDSPEPAPTPDTPEDAQTIESFGTQRNSFRKLKQKRHLTTSVRPQDIMLGPRKSSGANAGPEKPPRQMVVDDATPTEVVSSENKTEPGPEEFTEIAIDVPEFKDSRHISFDMTDTEGSGRSVGSHKVVGDEDQDVSVPYEKSRTQKLLNYLLCRRDLANAKLSEKPVKFWDLFKYGNRLDMFLVIVGLILAAVCGVCQPLFAVISGRLANTLLLLETDDPEFHAQGMESVVYFTIIGTFLVVVAYIQFICFHVACTRITRNIRNAYLKSILRQNAQWFERNHSGALNTKLNDNIERISEGISDKLGLLMRTGVQYVAGIIVAFMLSWEMALPLMVFSPMIAFAMSVTGKKISQASREEMKIYADAGCIAEEAITAYRTVAAFNAQEIEVKRYENELLKGVKAGVTKGLFSGALSGVMFALVMVFMGSAIVYGAFLHSIDIIKTPGDIFAVLMAIMSGAYHLGNASPHLMVLLTARVSAATVYKTINRVPKIDPYANSGRKIYDLQGKVVFKNVSFRYPSRPETKVLKSFSFSCNPGQTVALVGHSGSGKSTIVGILNRLYEFESGSVSIDGIDIHDLNVKWLRTVIGTVQQEPIIFNDTVENNIRLGCCTLTEKDMVDACRMANAHEFIESLPEGYNTRIGEGGVQLSGGQKQRIAIARTMARNPRILLLDEATSALDTHSEALVQTALNNASRNRTTIVIAHRLSTIRDADRIIVMHKGRFVECGNHNELLRRQGAYARLVRAQELDLSGADAADNSDPTTPKQEHIVSPSATQLPAAVRESIRQSFQRDFMPSEHMGDAETEALNIEVEKSGAKQASFGQIFLDAKNLWPALAVALCICFFNALSMPLNAFVYGKAFEMFAGGRKDNVGDAFMFFLFFLGIGVVTFFAAFLTTYMFGKIGETITMNMRVRAFRSIIYQDGSYFDKPEHTPGRLIARLATDAPNVKASMDTRLARVVQGILALCSAIVISLFIDWAFALVCSLFFVVLGIFQFFVAKTAHHRAVRFAHGDEAGRIAIEAIENVRTIQLLTGELEVHERFTKYSMKRQHAEIEKAPIEALNFATTHGLQQFTLAFCYLMGFIFVTNELTDKISLFQVVQTMYFGAASVIQATEFFPEFVKSRLAASLMYQIINRVPRTGSIDAGEKITLEGEVKFENVYFAYPMRPKNAVMKGMSLQARPGQTVALVGPSGSGKSTVISLLERCYDPSVGTIKLDGKDLKSLNLREIRRQMALVEQQPRLFSGTIKENIAYGLDLNNVSMDEIVKAATIANASSFISMLPMHYDTPLGEKGAQLSGGQKQRIAIARAMIRNPKVLLLDEATSALDSSAEKAVQDALDKARKGRTCITIAHRLSSIQNSDQIVFVEAGKVRERGTHVELLQQQGKYFNLIQKQHLGVQ